MKLLKARTWLLAAALAVAGGAQVASAQTPPCNIGNPPSCAGCAGGCGGLFNVWHATGGANARFDFKGTKYENSCGTPPSGGFCPTAQDMPPIRFWSYGNYDGANSGCQSRISPASEWAINRGLEDGIGPIGEWYLYQSSWTGPSVDGCFATTTPPGTRVALDVAWVDSNSGAGVTPAYVGTEGTINHTSWYLAGTVQLQGSFDFDTLTGGPLYAAQPVTSVTVGGITTCAAGGAPVQGTANANAAYFNLAVTINDTTPTSYGDASFTGQLIQGYQIVYTTGATPPTSSGYFSGSWLPARDQANPTLASATIPAGTATANIALPATAGTNFWLAARIIYTDPLNPTGTWDPASAPGPLVATEVGAHCGPAIAPTGGPIFAVEFGAVKAVRTAQGVRMSWDTLSEEDTNYFKVMRSTDAAGLEALVEAVPFVDSLGHAGSYEAMDTAVAGDSATTYYYYVQEMTSQGYGSRSESIKVEGASVSAPVVTGGSRGGRSRRN